MKHLRVVGSKTLSSQQGASAYKAQARRCVILPADLDDQLRTFAFRQRLGNSSVVQVALQHLFAQGDDLRLGALVRDLGASLRRK